MRTMCKFDHSHQCAGCGQGWECEDYTLTQCLRHGVYKASSVNHEGPYCDACRERIMRERLREIEGLR
jgi:hypothetical protein